MSKYGSGVGMRDVILSEVKRTNTILNASNLDTTQKEEILDILKEMAYQWCSSNATACAFEEAVKGNVSEEQFAIFAQQAMRSEVRTEKMRTTYPY